MDKKQIERIKASVDDCAAMGVSVVAFVITDDQGKVGMMYGTQDPQKIARLERAILEFINAPADAKEVSNTIPGYESQGGRREVQ